ncbi:MAG: 5'/3'-nucleotidase SurE [Opitutaceae bacterium]
MKHVLVTNDDGIDSHFLNCLVAALSAHFKVSVAAPATEQSWIGRAVSRHSEIEVIADTTTFPESVDAWSINGTPTDCVNIALGNLLDSPPDIVVSGINIGFNTTETLILSSGTVAGAIEGALWELPAIAFSQCVPGSIFERIRDNHGNCPELFASALSASAEHAAQIAIDAVKSPPKAGTVLNINFPEVVTAQTKIKDSYPAKIQLGSLYEEKKPGVFSFRYSDGRLLDSAADSDRMVLENGYISRSVLDFSKIGCRAFLSQ